jgi:hypothetical protein
LTYALTTAPVRYALGPWASFKELIKREWSLQLHNKLMFAFGQGQTAFVAFIVSTTFPQLPKDDFNSANLFLSVCFFSLMCMWVWTIACAAAQLCPYACQVHHPHRDSESHAIGWPHRRCACSQG